MSATSNPSHQPRPGDGTVAHQQGRSVMVSVAGWVVGWESVLPERKLLIPAVMWEGVDVDQWGGAHYPRQTPGHIPRRCP